MKIQKIPIDKINPAAYNPRKDLQPGDKEYQLLEKSIKEYGFIEPLIWNKNGGNLIGGHQRLKILKARGDTEVEVSVVELDDIKEKALNIALNKIGGDWNNDKLSEILNELVEIPDFDIDITGFNLAEMTDEVKQDDIVPFTLDDFEFDDIKEPCWFVIRGDLDDYEEIKKHITKLENNVTVEGSLDGQLEH